MSSPASFLLRHFDRLAEAPGGLAKLRALIMQLAVHGGITTPDKGSGSPANWKRVTVPPVGEQRLGKMLDKQKNRGEMKRYLRNINVRWSAFDLSDVFEMRFEEDELDEFRLAKGDVLICEGGYPGRAAVWEGQEDEMYFQKAIHRVRFGKLVDPYFFAICLRADFDTGRLAEFYTGTGIKHFTGRSLSTYTFPLPPLAEQRRIVAKVEELMDLCDALEAAQQERETVRTRLRASALHQFAAPDSDSNSAAFVLENLPLLTPASEDLMAIRRLVLDFAISGKLTEQNPSEEHASKLHARLIAAIKSHAGRSGISEHTPAIVADDKAPGPSPAGWVWTRLSGLFHVITDGDHQPPPKADDGIAFLTIGNITTGALDFSDCRFVPKKYWDALPLHRRPAYGDILYTVVGATYGRPALVETKREFCVQRHVAILKPARETDPKYLMIFLASRFAYEQATRSITGTAQPTIPLRPLRNFLIPLPPLAEQRRIVAKVDELMAVLAALEATLATARTTSENLLAATIAKLNASDENERPIIMAAEDPSPYGKAVKIPDFATSLALTRATLAGEIVHRMHGDRTFGQIKFQKTIYLAEYIAQLAQIDSHPERYQNGPHDPELIAQVEAKMKECEWFEAVPRAGGHGNEYHALAQAGAHQEHFEKLWPTKIATIRKLIDEMKTWKTERCERFATLYAAWNDLIIWNKPTDDTAILDQVLRHWHTAKQQIPKSGWQEMLTWMKREGYVPTGWGHATQTSPQNELF